METIASLLPTSLTKDETLKVLIKYFACDKAKATTLLASWPPQSPSEMTRLTEEIKREVGGNGPLRKLLSLAGY